VSIPLVAEQVQEASPREHVVTVSENEDQESVPQFRTLVFIQTTQFVTSDSSVWSVQVWRVTLFGSTSSPSQNRWLMVPVAHSI
jgi:hypothetical protein